MNKYVYVSNERLKSGTHAKRLMFNQSLEKIQIPEPLNELALIPSRPMSASISNLSILENKRQLLKHPTKSQDTLLKSLDFLKHSKIEFSIPEKEISTMLVHLDRISRNTMYGQKKVDLREGEKLLVELLPGESQYVIVQTRGEVCPLNVFVHKTSGAIECYMSKKIKEPTKIINDEVFTKDSFKIADKSFFFSTLFVALNFTAIKETTFTITIKFGQKVAIIREKNEISMPVSVPPAIVTMPMFEEKEIKKKPEKNFIKMNQTIEYTIKKTKNTKEIEQKRLIVRERYRNIQQKTLERRKIYIKKHEIRLDAELKGQEILDVIRRKQNFEKVWLTLSYLGSSLLAIRKNLKERRAQKIKRFIQVGASRKIQRKMHKFFSKRPLTEILLGKTVYMLKLYNSCTRFTKLFLVKPMISCINESCTQKKVPSIFMAYFSSICLIQNAVKEYLIMDKIRLQELDTLWTDSVNNKLLKIQSYKKKSKKWKKKMLEKYSTIHPDIKEKVIFDYLGSMKKRYLDKCAEFYKKNNRKMNFKEKIKLINADAEMVAFLCPPIFQYIPSSKEMMSLINSILGTEINETEA